MVEGCAVRHPVWRRLQKLECGRCWTLVIRPAAITDVLVRKRMRRAEQLKVGGKGRIFWVMVQGECYEEDAQVVMVGTRSEIHGQVKILFSA